MLVRASARRRELAIRSALGASRAELAGTLLIEGLVLSLAGTAPGVGLAWAGVEILRAAIPLKCREPPPSPSTSACSPR
jgi:ABC-type antimicrobial peptide transport system permease subunit